MSDLPPQPKVWGLAYVDFTASNDKAKIVVWVPKEICHIATDDRVEIRTLSRVMRYQWEPAEGEQDG